MFYVDVEDLIKNEKNGWRERRENCLRNIFEDDSVDGIWCISVGFGFVEEYRYRVGGCVFVLIVFLGVFFLKYFYWNIIF